MINILLINILELPILIWLLLLKLNILNADKFGYYVNHKLLVSHLLVFKFVNLIIE